MIIFYSAIKTVLSIRQLQIIHILRSNLWFLIHWKIEINENWEDYNLKYQCQIKFLFLVKMFVDICIVKKPVERRKTSNKL